MESSEYKEQFFQTFSGQLESRELAQLWRALKEDVFQKEGYGRFDEIIGQLKAGEPLQYVTSVAHFYGLVFHVSPDVLIPRPETEELVHFVLESHGRAPLHCIDIGTGSGCIPCAIKKHRPRWHVSAMDVSAAALAVASDNAKNLALEISCIEGDMVDASAYPHALDIVICNPPYVLDSDREFMASYVVDHEPHVALFVPDTDPLKYYRAVLDVVAKRANSVHVYFEIHHQYSQAMLDLCQAYGTDVQLKKDMQGHDRMLYVRV